MAFGYKRVRLGRVNKKNQEVCDLVIDEAEAEIVRLIFHKYVYEGYGAQKMSHYLYEQGVVGRNNKNIPNPHLGHFRKNRTIRGRSLGAFCYAKNPLNSVPKWFFVSMAFPRSRICAGNIMFC